MTQDTTHTIVVGIDGSAHSVQALLWAARDAELRGCTLHLVHVLPRYEHDVPFFPPGRFEEAEARGADMLTEAVAIIQNTHSHLPWTSDMPSGSPAEVFIEKSRDAHSLVLGARGHDVGNLLMGSVATQVAGHALSPVVVVGQPAAGHGRVVVGNDGSYSAAEALLFAFEEASLRGSELQVVRSWRVPLPKDQGFIASELKSEHARRLRELTEDLEPLRAKYPDVEVVEEAPCDKPVHALARASHRADLLVVGSRGLGGFHGLNLGSVSQKLLQMATCPVAVVRPAPEPV